MEGIRLNGTLVSARKQLNLIEGSGITMAVTDSATVTNCIDITLQSSGGSGDVSADAIWDDLGDLAVGTGADSASKLTVGTDGQVLAADSSAPVGVKWASLAGNIIPVTFAHSGTVVVTTEGDSPPPLHWYNDSGVTFTIAKMRARAEVGPSGSTMTIDINEDGTTIFSSTKLVLPNNSGAVSTITAVTAALATTTIADGHYLSVNVDSNGGGAVANLLITIWLTG